MAPKNHSTESQNVSRETISPMSEYVSLLLKWNRKINLIGVATASEIWKRHIEDSLQLVPLIPKSATSLVDLGSGAGLPGLVIAIQCPTLAVTLVEQDQRKAAFLTEVRSRLNLSNVTVKAMDIANLNEKYDVVTSRALASLDVLLGMAHKLMGEGAIGLFPKGKNHASELENAAQHFDFKRTLKPSATRGDSCIVTITQLSVKHSQQQ